MDENLSEATRADSGGENLMKAPLLSFKKKEKKEKKQKEEREKKKEKKQV